MDNENEMGKEKGGDREIEKGAKDTTPSTKVILAGIDIPFSSMVALIFKWTFAALPTVIVLLLFFWEISLFKRE